ncbi:hypothetical protein F5X98DRAFT_390874 [Xylaria grammica]|nr:hypothetical protein F5X98DRAFT_390874 [Xylaria grammica]
MAVVHQSFFEYSLTRPYPFKWFTPVAVVGGIVATILVSFFNVAAAGYELVPASSRDPNVTEAERETWLSNLPSNLIGAIPSCDATSMQMQSTFYTNKQAFPWTIQRISPVSNSSLLFGSVLYKNNVLQNCNVSIIRIEFQTLDRDAGQISLIPTGGTISATTKCSFNNGEDIQLELETTYDIVPTTENSASFPTNLSPSTHWGYSLIQIYWRSLMQTFHDVNVHREEPFSKGVVRLAQNRTLEGSMADQVKNPDFISVSGCFFVPLNSTGVESKNNRYCGTKHLSELADSPPTIFERPLPAIWRSVGALGKAMFFTVLADLGRNNDTMPNMLAHPDLLASLSMNLTAVNETLREKFRWGMDEKIFQQSFDPSQSQYNTQSLSVDDSMLVTDYLCQIPRLKSPGTLFLSVLVADLVILQTIWKIYTLVVDNFFLEDKDKEKH